MSRSDEIWNDVENFLLGLSVGIGLGMIVLSGVVGHAK